MKRMNKFFSALLCLILLLSLLQMCVPIHL